MSYIWIGGEDTSWPGASLANSTNPGRSSFTRAIYALSVAGGIARSKTFAAQTSCWVHANFFTRSSFTGNLVDHMFGIIKSGTDKGIFIGNTNAALSKLSIYKFDGGTATLLASESGTSLTSSSSYILDMQIISFGASCTINIYLGGTSSPLVTFTGNASISGISDLDQLMITNSAGTALSGSWYAELAVSDSDTRGIVGILTGALTGAGTTTNWSNNTYTNINAIALSDTNPAYTNAASTEQQYNVTDPPSGSFTVSARKVEARAVRSGDSTPTTLKLGWNDGGSITLGSAQSLSLGFDTYEELTNTALPIANLAGLQVDIKT